MSDLETPSETDAGLEPEPEPSEIHAEPSSGEQVREGLEPVTAETLELAREDALDFLEGVLDTMGLEGEVQVDLEEDAIRASITGGDLGILIGRHGLTLNALQELLRAAIQHQARGRVSVVLDVEGYRERRREAVERHALMVAHRVAETGGEVELDPMPAFERKVVHEAVSGVSGVSSFSEGEEPHRRVIIRSQE